MKQVQNSHEWEDISYHGSPTYQCNFCDCMEYSKEAALPCPKAQECLEKRRQKQEQDEYYEYLRLKAKLERWEYLKNKYESTTYETSPTR